MTSDAAQLSARRPNPNARVRVDLTVREAILLYGLASMAHAAGTRVTATVAPADADAATALNWATCKLYTGLRGCCGSGL